MQQGQATLDTLMAQGMSRETATATLNMFATIALCFAFTALLIWFAPKPTGPIDTGGGH